MRRLRLVRGAEDFYPRPRSFSSTNDGRRDVGVFTIILTDLQIDLNSAHNNRLDSIDRDCKVRGAPGNAFDAAGNTDPTAGAGSGRAATADSSDSSGIADTGDPK